MTHSIDIHGFTEDALTKTSLKGNVLYLALQKGVALLFMPVVQVSKKNAKFSFRIV